MDTLFSKLRASASEEATQLIHNRLFEKIHLRSPDADYARLFLSRRLDQDPGWNGSTLNKLCDASRDCGHWSFLRNVVDQLHASGIQSPTDADLVAASDSARLKIS